MESRACARAAGAAARRVRWRAAVVAAVAGSPRRCTNVPWFWASRFCISKILGQPVDVEGMPAGGKEALDARRRSEGGSSSGTRAVPTLSSAGCR